MDTYHDTHQHTWIDTYEETHFGHREAIGHVVDLYWDPADAAHEFRVEVLQRRSGVGLVLYPATGREALQAFHHPFAAAQHHPTALLAAVSIR